MRVVPHAAIWQTWAMNAAIFTSDRDILDGEPVFAGTRVPVKTLTDYLGAGESIDAFLDDFPTVTREQAVAFLKAAHERLVAQA
jgi:uncharacterized protein (DUF433 family)